MKALITNRSLFARIPNMLLSKTLGATPTIEEVPKPCISDNELLIKVRATSLNPIDCKFIDFIAPAGSKTGCDFAGTVSEVGKSASGTWSVGDRVAGFVQGGVGDEYGSFAEYVKAEQDLVWRVPKELSDEDASTYGVAAVTAMQALNHHLGVPWLDESRKGKSENGKTILIYSGATAVGLFAIQIAKAAGCTVVTTCSPHSSDLVKSYGADAVYDYRSSTAVKDITQAYSGITRALDCISTGSSTQFCADVLAKKGGKVITLLDTKAKTPGVEVEMIMSFQLLGRAFAWLPPVGPKYEVSAEARAALVRYYKTLPEHVKRLRAPPTTLQQEGFAGVLEGLDKLRAGKVSGSKLVVRF